MLISAKTLEALCADSFCAHQGSSKGERLGAFSWFVLCRAAKNERKKANRSARDEGAQYERM
jgi:hypothetical protein